MGVGKRFTSPEQLSGGERITGFHCGVPAVDFWAEKHAHTAKERGTAVVYVSYTADRSLVAGFYTLSSHSVARSEVSGGWLRRNTPDDIPVVLLGMLGVDTRFQGGGLGSALLSDAIARSLEIAGSIGVKALIVDPVDDNSREFYEKHGFRPVFGTDRMYVSLKL